MKIEELPLVTFDPATINESPWCRGNWHGRVVSIDGLALETPVPDDPSCVTRVLALSATPACDEGAYERGDYFGGHSVGLALLTDGRYIGWDSPMDVTGTGFHEDAYGGEADIFVAMSPVDILRHLGEQAVEQLRFASLPSEQPLAAVLRDAWLNDASTVSLYSIARDSGEFGELVVYRVNELVLQIWKESDANTEEVP